VTAFNRTLWIIIGAVLTAAGVVGVLARFNVMPGIPRSHALITPGMDAQWRSWDPWATAGVIVAGVLAAVAGVLLLRAQFRRRGGRSMPNINRLGTVPADTSDGVREAGRTRVATSTLRQALTTDLQADVRVRRAAVRLTGAPSRPDLHVQLAVTPDADVTELRRHVDRAMRRFSTTSGLDPSLAEVVVRVSSNQRERVH
jgi:hypothetical protein